MLGLGILAAVSTVFGMMMAVASDLPELELERRRATRIIYDGNGRDSASSTATRSGSSCARADRARDEARDHRDRGPALLHQRGRRPARHRPRPLPGHRRSSSAVQGGSTITQQFVKNALAAQDDRTRVPEAARGRARLPPHAQVVEGADPQRLPEHDLLRQRRLRDRGGRAHLLPAQPPGLRRDAATSPAPPQLAPARGGAARRR